MINDCRGTGKRAKCEFRANNREKTVSVWTTRAVRKGEELYVGYGAGYWRDLNAGLPTARKGPRAPRAEAALTAGASVDADDLDRIHEMMKDLTWEELTQPEAGAALAARAAS